MNVLHYTIGLPTKRNGGSIRYAAALAESQYQSGIHVYLLTPGDTLFKAAKFEIKKSRNYRGIPCFHFSSPLTPTLIYGTSDLAAQLSEPEIDESLIAKWIKNNSIDLLHLHTLQGFPLKLLKVFKKLGTKIVYTTHDYHGLCLKYNFINHNGEPCPVSSKGNCVDCLGHAPSDFSLRLINSNFYQQLKAFGIGELFKELHAKTGNNTIASKGKTRISQELISQLSEKYEEYFKLIDTFHFNSTQTKTIFENKLGSLHGKVINLMMPGLEHKFKPQTINSNSKIQIGYIGNTLPYKGYDFLREISMEIGELEDCNIEFIVYSGQKNQEISPGFKIKPKFSSSELSEILYSLDALIVPSICLETFSLVTIEGLAHGVPVIVSSNVGAKNIIEHITPKFVYNTKEELKNLLLEINRDHSILQAANQSIKKANLSFSFSNHASQILELYQ